MEPHGATDHKIEPEFLGPLGDRPLAEMAGASSPDDLFPGASKFLNARQQRRRREQWNAVRPRVGRVLAPDEHLLHVVYAQQIPPFFHGVGLGYLVYAFHQVVLLLTDRRIVEVLLTFRGTSAGTRIRSYPYHGLSGLKLSFGKLTAVPAQGRKQGWKIRFGGDRKLLKLLLPRLQTRLLAEGAAHAEAAPLWHCPQCGVVVPPAPRACAACRTRFRSTRLATVL
ncbi:MAG TPA: zinc ribbon domain-containing protein, partial [Candidatus Polarisedimenticolia bacterium]|nr:zinc ribbon domain-containing protein [Candidatus Polarisedimenticolia bacterium]